MPFEHTLYELLEVSPRASAQVIKAAYRCLVQRCHPDKYQGAAHANEQLAQINLAYAILSNPVTRLAYDRKKSLHTPGHERRGQPPPDSAFARTAARGSAGAVQARPFGFRPL